MRFSHYRYGIIVRVGRGRKGEYIDNVLTISTFIQLYKNHIDAFPNAIG